MIFNRQMIYLMKQELRSASRSRYLILSFVLLPIFMWVLQGGVQMLVSTTVTSTPNNLTIYVTNTNTENVTIPEQFPIPFSFQGYSVGQNVTTNTSFDLANYFVEYLTWYSKLNFTGNTLYNAKIITTESYSNLTALKDAGKVDYWLQINSSFATIYNTYGLTTVHLDYLQTTLLGPTPVQLALNQILSSKPFTIVNIQKRAVLSSSEILLSGETSSSASSFGSGFAGFLGILLAVMVPAPFVATSIAGEREKKTLESLLALPISRNNILLGKLFSGMVLVALFCVLNIVGMELFIRLTSGADYGSGTSLYAFELTPTTIVAITLAMGLSSFIAIGLGISLVSYAKDVRTSESLYQFVLMFPSMIVGLVTMFVGVPENIGGAALLLYLIPFTHALAIFQEILRPSYYNANSLLGFGLIGDLIFHFVFLVATILLVLYIASKTFDRESIIN